MQSVISGQESRPGCQFIIFDPSDAYSRYSTIMSSLHFNGISDTTPSEDDHALGSLHERVQVGEKGHATWEASRIAQPTAGQALPISDDARALAYEPDSE